MAGKYVARQTYKGGVSFKTYLDQTVRPSVNETKDWVSVDGMPSKLMVTNQTGDFESIDSWRAGIHFKELSPQFKNDSHKFVTKSSPTVLGMVQVSLVEWLPALYACFGEETYSGVKYKDVVIPLAVPKDAKNEHSKALSVIYNLALAWITDYQFGLARSHAHCTNMYMSAIHSIIIQLLPKVKSNAAVVSAVSTSSPSPIHTDSPPATTEWEEVEPRLYRNLIQHLFRLIQVTKHYMSLYPESRGPMMALVDDTLASDMTQRCLALEMFPHINTTQSQRWHPFELRERWLSVVQMTLQRWQRHPPVNKTFVSHLPHGMFSCLIVIPHICHYAIQQTIDTKNVDSDVMVNRCYDSIVQDCASITSKMDLVTVGQTLKLLNQSSLQIAAVVMDRLLQRPQVGLTSDLTRSFRFYQHCTNTNTHNSSSTSSLASKETDSTNRSQQQNWVELGLMPVIPLPFLVMTDQVSAKRHMTMPPRVCPIYGKKIDHDLVTTASTITATTTKTVCPIYGKKFDDGLATTASTTTATTTKTMKATLNDQKDVTLATTKTSSLSSVSQKDVKTVDDDHGFSTDSNVNVEGIKIETANPAEWSGYRLSESGMYEMQTVLTGGSRYGSGDTRDQTNVANMRFTVGNALSGYDIFPTGMAGFSSAGMRYDPHRRQYIDTHKPMQLSKPFRMEYKIGQSFTLYGSSSDKHVDTNVWYQQLIPNDSMVLIGFKYCHLHIRKISSSVVIDQPVASGPFGEMMKNLRASTMEIGKDKGTTTTSKDADETTTTIKDADYHHDQRSDKTISKSTGSAIVNVESTTIATGTANPTTADSATTTTINDDEA